MADGTNDDASVRVTHAGRARYNAKSGQATIPSRVRDLFGYAAEHAAEFEVFADEKGRQIILVEAVDDQDFDTQLMELRRRLNAARRSG
ncbi:MAG TPA: hypothetical protein VF549_08510 [Solirubrobacteraceae bacterium]